MAESSFIANFLDDEKITFTLTVTDEYGLSYSDTVDIDVVKVNRFINDAGVTVSGAFTSGNDISCSVIEGVKQDCNVDRDAHAIKGTLDKIRRWRCRV